MRSPVFSRSNSANDIRMLSVSRPIEVLVSKDCVTLTKETPCSVKSAMRRVKSAILVARRQLGDGEIP